MNEKPDDIAQASQGWSAFADLVQTARTTLHDNFNKVEPTWDSDAGGMFTAFVVGTTSTLSDWQQAAKTNSQTLEALAATVTRLQKHMQDLWNEFDSKAADAKKEEDQSWLTSWTKLGDDLSGHNPFDDVMQTYTNRAKSEVLEPLNKAFADAYLGVRPGMKWGGPTNGPSEADLKKAMTTLATAGVGSPGVVAPSAPSTAAPARPATPPAPPPPAPPAAPTAPNKPTAPVAPPPLPAQQTAPTVPTAPTMPNAPTAPTAPQAPTAPSLPNALTKPDLPTAPSTPSAPSAPTAPDALLAMPPLSPNALRSPGGLPSSPSAPDTPSLSSLGRGAPSAGLGEPESMSGMPGRPTSPGIPKSLQGRGGGMPDEPEMPPGMRSGMRPPPMLRGRDSGPNRKSGRSGGGPNDEEPEMPGRGSPGLSGRNGKQNERTGRNGRPGGPGGGDDDIPPNRLGSRRNLQGVRDTKPRWRPGSLEAEEMPLRRLPTLNGRFAPESTVEESLESAEQALRPGLGGRGLSRPEERAPERRRPKPRKETKKDAPAVDFVGDSELFTPEQSAPAVIDRPEEAAPVVPEKAALRPQT
jgi:hypothetical protein